MSEPTRPQKSPWRTMDWLFLVYLVIPFFQPIFSPENPPGEWLLAAGFVGAFLPVFVAGVLRPERSRLLAVLTTLLGVAGTPFNTGLSILFVYAAAFAASVETRRVALRWLAALTVILGVLGVVSLVPLPWRLWGLLPSLLFIWVIGFIQIEGSEKGREAAELRMRNARVEHLATVSERERIARDLHDLLGHSLTAVVVRAQLVRQLVPADPDKARTEAAEIEQIARNALSEVRSTLGGWRQASLDDELESARATLASMGVELTVHQDDALTLVGSVEHALALALREAVTNVARHARARTCHVRVGVENGELRLVVADDGRGGHAREGNGLAGIRERVTALGGTVDRTGTVGTTITIAVPAEVAL
ncbi:two-component system, NarL family, sensor histidine kinase DesK [Amycolatopsis marina]|uniref:Two-component system, NarL family, sensor histidine kinase DesK n=1 Tax=Amycolatopsis marina TaxID=490629 RepID=A0A1I0VD63_9PSEU|nr:sensor histidine kinase [Amycolatopsis marina]SFA74369.1 two-component system, NarL family, sensor histidine kinase DesK [Amycolatopsis marina]